MSESAPVYVPCTDIIIHACRLWKVLEPVRLNSPLAVLNINWCQQKGGFSSNSCQSTWRQVCVANWGMRGGGLKSKHQSHDTQLSLAHHWIDFFSLITQIYIVHIRETVWGSVFVVSIHFILKRQFTPKSFFSLWLLFIHLYCFGVSCGTIMELDGTRLVVVKLAKNKCETVRGLYFFLFSGWTAQGPHCLAILALQGEMWNKGVMYGKQGHRFY